MFIICTSRCTPDGKRSWTIAFLSDRVHQYPRWQRYPALDARPLLPSAGGGTAAVFPRGRGTHTHTGGGAVMNQGAGVRSGRHRGRSVRPTGRHGFAASLFPAPSLWADAWPAVGRLTVVEVCLCRSTAAGLTGICTVPEADLVFVI